MFLSIHFFFQFTYFTVYFIFVYFSNFRGSKTGGPWTRSMKVVHGLGPYFDGPGPRRGSMDQGSMFCTFPCFPVVKFTDDCVLSFALGLKR